MLRNTEPGQEGVESFHYPEKRFEIIFYLAYRLKQILATVGNGKKPGVHFGHDNDPLGSVCQELCGFVPHCRLRAVPRITAVLMSFFDLGY